MVDGKGGVGKTTIACLTALHTARQGYRTLLLTTDPAAHTGSVLGKIVTDQVGPVDGVSGLSAAKIDQKQATEDYKKTILDDARTKFGEDTIRTMTEELASPCTEEMAAFQRFIDLSNTPGFDVIVFDTAPTGHTLRLLQLPVEWSKHIRDSAQGSGQTCMGPVALIQDSKQKYDDAIARLRDTGRTQFIFVMQAEQTSLEETSRSIAELAALGVVTSRIIVNGLIPEAETVNPFFRKRRDMQQTYLKRARQLYAGTPVQTMELLDSEIKGVAMFRKCAPMLFQGGTTDV
jgi:arsenite-transporting ATPase